MVVTPGRIPGRAVCRGSTIRMPSVVALGRGGGLLAETLPRGVRFMRLFGVTGIIVTIISRLAVFVGNVREIGNRGEVIGYHRLRDWVLLPHRRQIGHGRNRPPRQWPPVPRHGPPPHVSSGPRRTGRPTPGDLRKAGRPPPGGLRRAAGARPRDPRPPTRVTARPRRRTTRVTMRGPRRTTRVTARGPRQTRRVTVRGPRWAAGITTRRPRWAAGITVRSGRRLRGLGGGGLSFAAVGRRG
jgi:hypothetical protein